MDFTLVTYFVILFVAFGLLLTERLRTDVVAVLIVLALALTGVLKPEEALSGFSSEPAIVVAGIFVLAGSLHQTGLSEIAGRWIGRLAGSSYTRIMVVTMPAVAVLSAFTHHVTTTAVMLPVMLNLAKERNIPASRLLMPMSFAASLGTTITIIGAPAFLIASGVLQQNGRPGLSVFSIAPIGVALSVLGTAFVLLLGRVLLPARQGLEDPTERFRLDKYYTELAILPDSPFLGKTIDEVHGDNAFTFEVHGWLRRGHALSRPFGNRTLREGDVLLITASPDEIVTIRQEVGVELKPVEKFEGTSTRARPEGASNGDEDGSVAPEANNGDAEIGDRLVQAVVAPGSSLVDRTLSDLDFFRRHGAIVLGLWRKRAHLNGAIAHVPLKEGDVLVLHGDDETFARMASDRHDFLMLVPFQGEARPRRRAPVAAAIMLGTILAAVAGVSLPIAALAGAVAVVLTGCMTPRQAYRAIDRRIFVFIAGAIPLGTAMTKTGASEVLAGWLQYLVGGWNDLVVLLVVFWVVAILTQFMSDSATTAIFGPVAAALAAAIGHAPEPYVVTVAMASVAAFLTPIGHHGNLLIYGPGRYRFADFVRVGTPLTVLVGFVVVFISRMLWPG